VIGAAEKPALQDEPAPKPGQELVVVSVALVWAQKPVLKALVRPECPGPPEGPWAAQGGQQGEPQSAGPEALLGVERAAAFEPEPEPVEPAEEPVGPVGPVGLWMAAHSPVALVK